MGESIDYALLGLPFFSAFHIVLDRTNFQIGFQPGCGCNTTLDKYPMIITDSSADSSKNWTCQTYSEPTLANVNTNVKENAAVAYSVSCFLSLIMIVQISLII